jgi:hypothetical protein
MISAFERAKTFDACGHCYRQLNCFGMGYTFNLTTAADFVQAAELVLTKEDLENCYKRQLLQNQLLVASNEIRLEICI